MKLTKLQRRTLRFFHSFRSERPKVGRQLCFNWFAWVPLLLIAVAGCLLVLTPGLENAGWLWIGLVAGTFFRDIGRYRATARIWPVYQEIVDWQRVATLLESDEKHDA